MSRPSDDELEAMAEYWDNSGLEHNPFEKADATADMLRACKGRLRVKALDNVAREEIIEAAHLAMRKQQRGVRGQTFTEWDTIESWVIVETERRVLAALEPAPDHSEWNAAIEAAAKVAREMADLHGPNGSEASIRQLKKGPRHD